MSPQTRALLLGASTCAINAVLNTSVRSVHAPRTSLPRKLALAGAAGLSLSLGTLSLPTISHAQTAGAPSIPAPPIREAVDENGVDLLTGRFNSPAAQLSIGDPAFGGLTRIYKDATVADNFNGSINQEGSTYVVSLGGSSEPFSEANGVFTPQQGSGSTLTRANGTYTYTTADGAVAEYETHLAGGSPTRALTARLSAVTAADGEKVSLVYRFLTFTRSNQHVEALDSTSISTTIDIQRLQAVVNNLGYMLKYEYAGDADVGSATTLASVTALNTAVETCDGAASTCALTHPWPKITISGDTVTDSLGRSTTYPGEGPGPQTLVGPTGTTLTVTRDAEARVTSITNTVGEWSYTYVDNGGARTTTVQGPLGRTRTVVLDIARGLVTSDTDALNRTTSYAYDNQGRLESVTRPEGNGTRYAYDSRGNITQMTAFAKPGSGLAGALGSVPTIAGYDPSCSPSRDATNSYLKCNRPNYTEDAKGNRTDYSYDPNHGGLLSVTHPAGPNGVRPQTRYTYSQLSAGYKNRFGQWVAGSPVYRLTGTSTCAASAQCAGAAEETRSEINYSSGQAHNLLPLTVTTKAGDGSLTATTTMTHDDRGDLVAVDGPLGGQADTVRYRYDAERQLVGVVEPDPDGSGPRRHRAARLTYRADGQVRLSEQGTVDGVSDGDWAGFSSQVQQSVAFDGIGRPVQTSVAAGGASHSVTEYSYDAANRLECAALRMNPAGFSGLPASACLLGQEGPDGPDRVSRISYDQADQVLSVTSGYATAAQRVEAAATYSLNGQVATLTDGNGNRTTYERDGFDRPSKVRYPTGSNGAVSSTTDYESYTYDLNSNVSSLRLRDSQTLHLGYDALNRLVSGPDGTTYSHDNLGQVSSASRAGQTITFQYDALSRLTSETGSKGPVRSEYNLAGDRTRLIWPDNASVNYEYNSVGAVTMIKDGGGTPLGAFDYDDLGRRTRLSRVNGLGTDYTYDAASRLSGMHQSFPDSSKNQSVAFSYNAAGQIKGRTSSNGLYDKPVVANAAQGSGANGLNQLTSGPAGSLNYDSRGNLESEGGKTYSYDVANRLTSGPGASLAYDPAGRLKETSANGAITEFVYDGQNLIAEYRGSTLVGRYVHGPAVDEPLVVYEPEHRRFYVADERGSVTGVTSDTGALVAANTYDEYGAPAKGNQGRFQYTGQAWLPDLQLQHSKARAYSPSLGRFLQPDPVGYYDGLNQYAYVGNDPMNAVDPTGLAVAPPLSNQCDGGVVARGQQNRPCNAPRQVVTAQRWVTSAAGIFRDPGRAGQNDGGAGGGSGPSRASRALKRGVKLLCKAPAVSGSYGVDVYHGLGTSVSSGISFNPSNGQISIGLDLGVGVGFGRMVRVQGGRTASIGNPESSALPSAGGGMNANATFAAASIGGLAASYQLIGSNRGDYNVGFTRAVGLGATANANISAHGQFNLPPLYKC